ncbi:hypothetical protein LYNGBM3L_74290 [Moorena producens 3L]|uniref:Uncharacterized protein n=1 Tax=Moorena producens 3L TaxID=489825 RepID=F4XRB0_9CYAN|nr:hypothetical protein LYNGBM3L_74290 [Moorena producens 3L]
MHQLERANRFAELFALVDVRQDRIKDGLHDAERHARQHHALIIETAHQDLGALAKFADQILFRHDAVFEHQFARIRPAHAKLVELLGGREAFHVGCDQEG